MKKTIITLFVALTALISFGQTIPKGTATGTNSYSVASTVPTAPATLIDGIQIIVKMNNSNSGASTLRLGTLAAKNIEVLTSAVSSGDIPADVYMLFTYNASEAAWQMTLPGNPSPSTPTITITGAGTTTVTSSGVGGLSPTYTVTGGNGSSDLWVTAVSPTTAATYTLGSVGIGTTSVVASLDIKTAGSDSSTSALYIRANNGTNILGVSAGGNVGINLDAATSSIVRGYIQDCALEVKPRTNSPSNSYVVAFKGWGTNAASFLRINNSRQAGYNCEMYQAWKCFGPIGFNINPDSSRQVQVQGWNTSASYYSFLAASSTTNQLNLENDGHFNAFGYFTMNRLATNASLATVAGQGIFQTPNTIASASGDGSATLRLNGTDTYGIDKGPTLAFEEIYDASNKYAMAVIAGRKENNTSGNSAGYLQFMTHTSGIGTMTEQMRITSAGRVVLATVPTYTSQAAANAGEVPGTVYKIDILGIKTLAITEYLETGFFDSEADNKYFYFRNNKYQQ